ncbi:tetratricopeptide repeat protein [Panacibacter sp. DH6]|uniref:Tetratricopeptide repeat protein n=1 Tax=Panacibacter microcysteis TaxID=2793269 RepID=A0A931E5I7_9BACT|nr:tetratricopeptide repeat protein [Panacibacter microcysteis]MBG9376562.1 tetratricopeptide repeat protein [Panacibacter microcysteis]
MTRVSIIIVLGISLFASCAEKEDSAGKQDDTTAAAGKPLPPYIVELESRVKANPDSAGLRLKLAAALDSIGAYKPALEHMDSLIMKDTTNYGLWYTKGRIAEDAGDTIMAMESYDKALRIYPSADAMLGLANLYAEQKNERALLICTNVKRLALGRDYDAHADFIAGIYNARTNNKEKALAFFDNCIANDYTYMPAYIEKGLVYFDNKAYQEALSVFKFASTINALDADTYYWQGRCYEMMQVKDSAALRFKQALNLEKGDAKITEALKRVE